MNSLLSFVIGLLPWWNSGWDCLNVIGKPLLNQSRIIAQAPILAHSIVSTMIIPTRNAVYRGLYLFLCVIDCNSHR